MTVHILTISSFLPSSTVVRVLPDLSDRYVISPDPGQFFLKLRLPEDVYCDQCILQVRPFDKGKWQSLALLLKLQAQALVVGTQSSRAVQTDLVGEFHCQLHIN